MDCPKYRSTEIRRDSYNTLKLGGLGNKKGDASSFVVLRTLHSVEENRNFHANLLRQEKTQCELHASENYESHAPATLIDCPKYRSTEIRRDSCNTLKTSATKKGDASSFVILRTATLMDCPKYRSTEIR